MFLRIRRIRILRRRRFGVLRRRRFDFTGLHCPGRAGIVVRRLAIRGLTRGDIANVGRDSCVQSVGALGAYIPAAPLSCKCVGVVARLQENGVAGIGWPCIVAMADHPWLGGACRTLRDVRGVRLRGMAGIDAARRTNARPPITPGQHKGNKVLMRPEEAEIAVGAGLGGLATLVRREGGVQCARRASRKG